MCFTQRGLEYQLAYHAVQAFLYIIIECSQRGERKNRIKPTFYRMDIEQKTAGPDQERRFLKFPKLRWLRGATHIRAAIAARTAWHHTRAGI
jgi:hypothetical protein